MSECPTGCGRNVDGNKLLCLACWRRVPGELQQAVYSTWNQYRPFVGTLAQDGRREAREAYQSARDAAITAVRR